MIGWKFKERITTNILPCHKKTIRHLNFTITNVDISTNDFIIENSQTCRNEDCLTNFQEYDGTGPW